MMPVLKANAAGMGIEQMGKFYTEECGIETVAVAQVYEAARLRQAGIKAEILVMGGVSYHNIPGRWSMIYRCRFITTSLQPL